MYFAKKLSLNPKFALLVARDPLYGSLLLLLAAQHVQQVVFTHRLGQRLRHRSWQQEW
jgi:hypothetical protein